MVQIRKATREDVQALHDLILDIAKYHDQEEYVLTNIQELLASGFSENPKFGAFLAEQDKRIVAYVSYTYNYSIWMGEQFLNIDDVFVLEECRGEGIGELLMYGVKEMCLNEGIKKVKWEVESDNDGAIKFYKRLGAELNVKGIFHWNV